MLNASKLLEQAEHLCSRDAAGRPRQDHLRRSISTGYYAIFHFLIDQACRSFVGTGADEGSRARRGVMARGFVHKTMKEISKSFGSGQPKAFFMPAMLGTPVPPTLRQIANTFVEMQERRHQADYDALTKFERAEVTRLLNQVKSALSNWQAISETPAAKIYMIALLTGGRD